MKQIRGVTVRLGIPDLKTGHLTPSNAGHEEPILRQPGGSFEIVKDRHGFVIRGLGIFLVRRTMDTVSYELVDGRNILRIRKLF